MRFKSKVFFNEFPLKTKASSSLSPCGNHANQGCYMLKQYVTVTQVEKDH